MERRPKAAGGSAAAVVAVVLAAGHGRDAVFGYAKQFNLDPAKFEADYTAFAPVVEADRAEGQSSGVEHTPTIFFNDRMYEGPPLQKYMALWIDEELAVNR